MAIPPAIPDVPEQPTYISLDENTKSELCVPLKIGDKVIGVLNVESYHIGAFDKRDQEQLEALASQAAIAIENARLLTDERRKTEQLERLNQVASVMTQAAWYRLDAVLQEVLISIDTILGEETSSCINLYDAATGSFGDAVVNGPLMDHLKTHRPRPDGTGVHVVRTKQPLFVNDTSTKAVGHPEMQEATKALGT